MTKERHSVTRWFSKPMSSHGHEVKSSVSLGDLRGELEEQITIHGKLPRARHYLEFKEFLSKDEVDVDSDENTDELSHEDSDEDSDEDTD